jgi:hypothetical protein
LEIADLKAQYNSYIAAGHLSVYNPVSVMSALEESRITNFWVATGLPITIVLFNQLSSTIGEYPLLNKRVPEDDLTIIEGLLTGADIDFELQADVAYSRCAHLCNSVYCVHAGMV